jgi:hypothetical protein
MGKDVRAQPGGCIRKKSSSILGQRYLLH